jgi:hypothetical protein
MIVNGTTRTSAEGNKIQIEIHNALSGKSWSRNNVKEQEHCRLHVLSTKKEKHPIL